MAWFRVKVWYQKQSAWGVVRTTKWTADTVVVKIGDDFKGSPEDHQFKEVLWNRLSRGNSSPSIASSIQVEELLGPYTSKAAAREGKEPANALAGGPPPARPVRPDFDIEFVESTIDACDLRSLDTVREWLGDLTPTMLAAGLPVVVLKVKTHSDFDGPFGEARVAGPTPDKERTLLFGHEGLRARVERPNDVQDTDEWRSAVVEDRLSAPTPPASNPLPDSHAPRGYGATATLLKDGRVLFAGGGTRTTEFFVG